MEESGRQYRIVEGPDGKTLRLPVDSMERGRGARRNEPTLLGGTETTLTPQTLREKLRGFVQELPDTLVCDDDAPSLSTRQRYGPVPDCPICDGHGWVVRNVPTDHPDFGKVFPCSCAEQYLKDRRLTRLWGASRIDPEYEDCTFNSYAHLPGVDMAAGQRVEQWAFTGERSLYLWGEAGRGKTALAICAARVRMAERGQRTIFTIVAELLDDIRSGFDAETGTVSAKELTQSVQDASLVILDDLGAERLTPWAQERLYLILNARYNKRLPVIITSNHDLDVEAQRLGERLGTRISHMCHPDVIQVRGRNQRRG